MTWAARLLLLWLLTWLSSGPALAQEGAAEPEAAEAEAEAEAAPERTGPAEVSVGMFVNDINMIDLRNHSFVIDLYVWFRWQGDDIDPGATFEFMNTGDPDYQAKTQLYEEPLEQPDGYLYQLFRYEGAFSNKFPVSRYPFDTQTLRVFIEDADMGSDELVYKVDELTMNPEINLPGYRIADTRLEVVDHPYPTTFGDRAEDDVSAYSRGVLSVTIERPWLSGATKTLLPILLIILCSAAALLLGAQHVEARIGLAITSLLALVALQFSMLGTLPEVGYLLMLDQLYIESYAFVLMTVAVIVWEKRAADRDELAGRTTALGGVWGAAAATFGYAVITAGIVWANLNLAW